MQVESEHIKPPSFELPKFGDKHRSKRMECYFAEINDLAQQMDYSDAQRDKPVTKPIHLLRQRHPNCYVEIQEEGLLVISKGGSNFHIPLEQHIENVFPLSEGLLIQYVVKHDPKFAEILLFQKNKQLLTNPEEHPRYSYVTLNKHPLNPLKVLGCLRKEEIHPWLNHHERIIFASSTVPLIISYNYLLQRNAFHLLKANIEESERDFHKVSFNSNFYTIKDLSQNPPGACELMAELFFEENTREFVIEDALLTRGREFGEIQVYLLIQSDSQKYVKVYSIQILGGCQVKLLVKIPDVVGISGFNLFDKDVHIPKILSVHRLNPKNRELQVQILLKAIKKLPQYAIIVDHSSYYICLNGAAIFRSAVLLQNKAIQIKSVEFTSQGQFQVETTGSIKFEYLATKKIAEPLSCICLGVISQIVQSRLFEKMLGDFLQLRTNNLSSSDWKIFHQYLLGLMKERSAHSVTLARSVTPEQFSAFKAKVLKVLHFLYEELKLYTHFAFRKELLNSLYILNLNSGEEVSYILCDFYMRQGAQTESTERANPKIQGKNDPQLTDIFKNLSQLFRAKKIQWELGMNTQIPKVPIVFRRTKFVYRLFEFLVDGIPGLRTYIPEFLTSKVKTDIVGAGTKDILSDMFPLHHQKVFYMTYYKKKIEGFLKLREMKESIDSKEEKVFLYLIEKGISLDKIKTFPTGISTPVYQILRLMRRNLPSHLYEVIPRLGFSLIKREDLHKNIKLYRKEQIRVPYHLQNQSLSSTIHTLIHSSISQEYYLTSNTFEMNKFNNDLVFKEVSRLLTSTTQIKIKAKQIESVPQDRWQLESQNIVMKFANRRLSVLTGQGAFTLGTSQTYITEVIKINKVNLSAIMPNDFKVTLDLKDDKQSLIFWPQFHNGVAAGLRLSRHIIPLSQDHLKTWIFYQKPELPRRDHSGFLLSLGLLGYLQCFSPTDIYQYLKPNNEFTSAAILLGVSASNIGKCQESLSKTLILHIPCLLPPTVDIEIPINVQSSALIGIGLLHKGTSNRTMTEMTLSQIGRRPNSDKCLDRQGYSLAAGWALGVICLGMSGTRESLRDLQLEQRLIRFIEGGKTMEPPQSVISSNFNSQNKCSSIKQGNTVNLHITAPSALIAISLMYLKSNSRDISSQITIPNSFNTIEQCNPNLILLKVIAKNLIMWKNIDNTPDFILGQIPELIRFIYENSLHNVHERYYLVYNVAEIDYHTITVIFASIMTGAVVAMGMRYAGTGDKRAVQTIQWHIQRLRNMKILKCQLANDPMNKNSIDQYTLFTLMCVSLLSLSLVMAGTCDVQCLKTARVIRKRIQQTTNFHYGFNMAVNMAIGFLCLGYGNYSFNRSDMSIAALLIAIYPYFPNSPSDNKWHLQALRHFYVLAVEEKVFHAVDVDTNKVVNVSLEMTFQVGNDLENEQLHTPVLLQQSKKLASLKIRDEDYFDVDFTFERHNTQPKAIYIKKKFSKEIDLHHFKSLNPEDYEHLPVTAETAADIKKAFNKEIKYKSVKNLSSKALDLTALNYILPNTKNSQKVIEIIRNNDNKPKFWTNLSFSEIVYQFMKEDRLDILQSYLEMIRREEDIMKWTTQKIDNLKLIKRFYESTQLIQGVNSQASLFFNPTKHELLYSNYEDIAYSQFQKLCKTDVFKSYLSKPDQIGQLPGNLIKVLNFFNVPNKYELKLIKKSFEKLVSMSDSSKTKTPKDAFNKKLMSVCEMYLYMSFPSCPIKVLNQIGQFFLLQ